MSPRPGDPGDLPTIHGQEGNRLSVGRWTRKAYLLYRRAIDLFEWATDSTETVVLSKAITSPSPYVFPSPFGQTLPRVGRRPIRFSKDKRHQRRALAALMREGMIELTTSDEPQDSVSWHVDVQGGTIATPQGLMFHLDSLDPGIFAETFVYDIHFQGFDLSGCTVLDAGGFVGDTALYYAARGANVLTFEPNPVNYQWLVKNLALNPRLANRIRPVHAAIGRTGLIQFGVDSERRGLGGQQGGWGAEERVTVQSYSLSDVLRIYQPRGKLMLHLDIKGNEAHILKEPLSPFERVRIEYSLHLWPTEIEGSLSGILDKLREDGLSFVRVFRHNRQHLWSLATCGTVDALRDRPG